MDDTQLRTPAPVITADRLASLSDTMFGVAMTLVVTTLLPSMQAHTGPLPDLLPAIRGELITVVLSFAISARYWITQQQRLAMTGVPTQLQTLLHLIFLFLIVLIPITTSLPGLTGGSARVISVTIYGVHLLLIALVNLALWITVHRAAAAHEQVMRSSLAAGLLAVALVVGVFRPADAMYVWFVVFAAPALGRVMTRWFLKR
jgi:uncharacterized membrane protein